MREQAHDPMKSRMATFLQIRPGEGRHAGLLIALFLLPNFGAAIGSPGVEALFYARFGVEFLPYLYIAIGVITFFVSIILTGLLGRLSKKRLYRVLPLILAGSLIFARVLVGLDLNWFYPLLWLWTFLMWTLQALFTWGVAGLVCDTRQAKRLFPLFGAGGIMGIALGGLSTRLAVKWIGVENLLLLWVGALLITFGLVFLLTANREERKMARRRQQPGMIQEVQKGFNYVRRTPLMRWIAYGTVFFSVLFFSVAFPFSKAVAAEFPREDSIAGFLGVFQGVKAIVEFTTSLLIANRLYSRIGYMSAILVFPLIYLFGFGVMLVYGVFIAIVAFRFLQMTWLYGVADTAYQSIFMIVPENQREQTRAFLRGVPEQIGVVLVGVIFVLGLNNAQIFILGMFAAMITTFAIWRAGRFYRVALVDALRAGQPHVFYSEEQPFGGFRQDAQAVHLVVAGVSDNDPIIRQVSVEILGNLAVPSAVPVLINALEDFDPTVRTAALKALARAGVKDALLDIAASLQDISPEVRLEAAKTLAKLAYHPRGLRIHLAPTLTDPDPRVQAFAAVSLLGHGRYPPAETALHRLVEADDPRARIVALEAFALWGHESGYEVAARSFSDPQPAVRKAATLALAKIAPERCQEMLILGLADEDHSVRVGIAEALGEVGEGVLSKLIAALDDPTLERGVLIALRYVPTGQASDELLQFARQKASLALYHGGCWAKFDSKSQSSPPGMVLLTNALQNSARQHAAMSLQAVGLLEDPDAMAITLENLNSRNPSQRANALEMLDSLPEREIFRPLLALWEADLPENGAILRNPASETEILLELLMGADPWLCACAILAAAGDDDARIRAAIEKLRKSDDPVLVETATHVLNGANMDTLATIPIMERILYLMKVPIFESLSPADLKQIAAIMGEYLFIDGEVIARQGDLGEEMYIIITGEVDVLYQEDDGLEKMVVRRTPGEYVGEMSMISHEPRMASLVAKGDVRTLCLEQKPFEAMLRERPEIGLAVMRQLIARLRERNL